MKYQPTTHLKGVSMSLKVRTIAKEMSAEQFKSQIVMAPNSLIASNRKLRKSHIWQWTIPALTAAIVKNGELKTVTTCPMAGECANACYAMQGAYNFSSSVVAHTRKLQFMKDHPSLWQSQIIAEIASKRLLKAFRIHDSGDFMSMKYALQWFEVIKALPNVQFYAYTKMVAMFKGALKKHIPTNLSLIFSYGGKNDHLIDPDNDRHSKVFPDHASMIAADYHDTSETDGHAADPSKIRIGLVYHGKVKFKGGMTGE